MWFVQRRWAAGVCSDAVNVLEGVVGGRVGKIVRVGGMRFGFVVGGGATDAAFIVPRQWDKCLAGSGELWMAFVDLETAFGGVPEEVVWWSLGYLGFGAWMVSVMGAMYESVTTGMDLGGREWGFWCRGASAICSWSAAVHCCFGGVV